MEINFSSKSIKVDVITMQLNPLPVSGFDQYCWGSKNKLAIRKATIETMKPTIKTL